MAEAKDISVANIATEAAPKAKPSDFDFDFINADDPPAPEKDAEKAAEPKVEAKVEPTPLPKYLLDAAAELGIDPKGTPDELGDAIHQAIKGRRRPVAPQHPASLLKAAHSLGINYDGMSTETLADLVLSIRAEQRQEAAKPAADEDEVAFKELEDDGMDKRFLAIVRKQKAKIKELEGATQASGEREARRRKQASEEAIDGSFELLGDKFSKLFGKGGMAELGAGPQRDKRIYIFKAAGIDFENDTESTIRRKITAAAKAAYGDLLTEEPAKVDKPAGKLTEEEWDKGVTRKPTSSDPVLGKREKSLLNATKEYMVKHGITNRDEFNDFNGVPE